MDEQMLKEMINEQKQIIKIAELQINKLYKMAQEMNINIEKSDISGHKNYIENQRQEIMKKMEQLRQKAMEDAQKALNGVSHTSVNNFNPNAPFDLNEIKNNIYKIHEDKNE